MVRNVAIVTLVGVGRVLSVLLDLPCLSLMEGKLPRAIGVFGIVSFDFGACGTSCPRSQDHVYDVEELNLNLPELTR